MTTNQGMGRLALLIAAACVVVGCGARFADFTPTATVPARQARTITQVQLLFKPEEPTCKYRVVGLYESGRKIPMTINGKASPEFAPMRDDAAKRGFDGVKDVECMMENGNCNGKAFVCDE